MSTLTLDNLPELPQSATLRKLAERLWAQQDVIALWLGGSLAQGTADTYSDIDLRVAIAPDTLDSWRTPTWNDLFDTPPVGAQSLTFGATAFLHHLVLANGDIVDLWLQSRDQDPSPDSVLVLGCRDADFADKLAQVTPHPAFAPEPADAEAIRQLIVQFWIASHKHRKVLARGLDMVAQFGVPLERNFLLRLWYVLATGLDYGGTGLTIHSLSPITRALRERIGEPALTLYGLPLRTRAEISAAIETDRAEVARVGRLLAERLHFDYPDALEQTARQGWAAFLK